MLNRRPISIQDSDKEGENDERAWAVSIMECQS